LKPLVITPLEGLPLIQEGDNLVSLIQESLKRKNLDLLEGDILVLAQKIVSKAEGRRVFLESVNPSKAAKELAAKIEKDPRLVQLILDESAEVLRARPGLIVVEHRLGFVSANAGIDHSNVDEREGWVLLLPKDPDASADAMRTRFEEAGGAHIGVLIIDSHGRAWREGIVGVAIGVSGLPGVVDLRGRPDLFGRELRATTVGAADELAAAASIVMGQAGEGCPAVHVRGFPYPLREGKLAELLRPKELDTFR
jgi:coenzyme F420-0:L-glutamate ligase/coenzyme F420-1:gamma-L-glutamate ligase